VHITAKHLAEETKIAKKKKKMQFHFVPQKRLPHQNNYY
jgi:hypothetical protein